MIAIPSTRAIIMVGGRVFTDITTLKILTVSAYSGVSGPFSTYRDGTSTGYQVPVGKTFRIHAVVATQSGTATGGIALGYEDVDNGLNSTAARTAPVYHGSYNTSQVQTLGGLERDTPRERSIYFSCAASKYIFMWGDTSGVTYSSTIYGYEV